jgi:hypothetical protein
VPLLVATGALACGPVLLGPENTDGTETDPTGTPTEPTGNPSDPTSNPSDPTTPTDPTVDPTVDPSDPTVDPSGTPHDGPPQLIAAQVLDQFTVELFFSEPIATISGIDTAKFRLSAAFSNAYYAQGTWYSDLGRWNGEEVCHEYCYGDYTEGPENCYEWCYTPAGPNVHVQGVLNGYTSDRVLLTLDQPITSNLCKQLQDRIENGADTAAIFLHYSNNGQGITDLEGEQLDAIAEHWVLLTQQYYSYQQGTFPSMNPFIPIACPF